MLLEFTVGNYRSFKNKKTLSLEASSITEFEDNLIVEDKYKLLKSVVIYGANSSGKSNLLNALKAMRNIVTQSASTSSTSEIDVMPFLLNIETEKQPSLFEVVFLIKNIRYRYGFEVDREKVHSEWLYELKKIKETELFLRLGEGIDISKRFDEGTGVEQKTRKNALFLATVDQFNGDISKQIMKWFQDQVMLSGLDHVFDRNLTMKYLRLDSIKKMMQNFINDFNFGFHQLQINEDEKSGDNSVRTTHKKFDQNGLEVGNVEFLMNIHESSGTNKLFDMAGWIWVGLFLGRVVVIDELDAKLHPLITQTIVKLFNSREKNPKGAQLIFATHDTNLLSCGQFRRDQIYFAEKNQFEATDIFSLVEYKDENDVGVRKDKKFEKDYIQGRYGAIPFVGDFSSLFVNG